jgi:hypothetical protein
MPSAAEYWYAKPEWWAIIISIAALTQSLWLPWLKSALWPHKVEIFEAILPDVNFGVAGSAIGLCGALVSRNIDSLVSEMTVNAKRLGDGAKCTFRALFNRARVLTMAGDNFNVTFWNVLQLPADEPKPYDVTFANEEAREAFKTANETFRSNWLQRVVQQIAPPFDDSIPDNAKRLAAANQMIFKDPKNSQFIDAALSEYLRLFYWVAGTYRITLQIVVDGTKRPFEKTWKITITADMEQKLRENARRMVATVCLQPLVVIGQYYTAWPTYESAS